MKVALYARVSTSDKGQDVQNQIDQLKEFLVKQPDWKLAGVFTDYKSGKDGDRDQFRAMFAAAHRREFDMVFFWSLDRFSREGARQTLNYLEQLSDWGVGWKSYVEPYLDSTGMFKEAVVAIIATIAKQERVRCTERVMAGLERAKAKGVPLGRPVVVSDVCQVVRLYAEGKSMREIARCLGLSSSTVMNRLRHRKHEVQALRDYVQATRKPPEVEPLGGGFRVLPSWMVREPLDDEDDIRNFTRQNIPVVELVD